LLGRFSPVRDWDPFDRTSSGLLLAEDFARADLREWQEATEWYLGHGVLDLHHVFPADEWRTGNDRATGDWFHDSPADVWEQQGNIQWLLLALARLSQGEDAWDPRWMEVILYGGGESLWLDIGDRQSIRFRTVPETLPPPPTETIWVPTRQWHGAWSLLRDGKAWPDSDGLVPLTPNREGHIELVRRLLEPHVHIAAQFEVELLWPKAEFPLVVSERRRWRSVLSPIYLQLLEGLRRITDGQRGAGFCRECGQPFLTLDARRSSFCNDKDRFRFSQRERRKRVHRERAALDAIAKMQEVSPESDGTTLEELEP
jgi:hypothetical protein